MLILSRKPGDAILIDGGIRIVVLACDGTSVRLGIDAPREVGIVREEVVLGITDENVRASATGEHQKFLEGLGGALRPTTDTPGTDSSEDDSDRDS